jgi:hypothetical protein
MKRVRDESLKYYTHIGTTHLVPAQNIGVCVWVLHKRHSFNSTLQSPRSGVLGRGVSHADKTRTSSKPGKPFSGLNEPGNS